MFYAESKGFEPLVLFTGHLVSSEALSTTQPTLHFYSTVRQAECSNKFVLLLPIPPTRPPIVCFALLNNDDSLASLETG